MDVALIDTYLLTGRPPKPELVASILAVPPQDPRSAPFIRALQALGERTADEALIALRLVAAGEEASDDRVRRLRGLAAIARGENVDEIRRRDGDLLDDLDPSDPGALRAAAAQAYHATCATAR